MPKDPDERERQRRKEAFYYRVVAGVLCFGLVTMGLLDLLDIV
jgi:hypothetical protein